MLEREDVDLGRFMELPWMSLLGFCYLVSFVEMEVLLMLALNEWNCSVILVLRLGGVLGLSRVKLW